MLQIGMMRHKRSMMFYPIIFSKMILVMIMTVLLKDEVVVLGAMLMVISMITLAIVFYINSFQKSSDPLEKGRNKVILIGSELILLIYFAMYCGLDPDRPSMMTNFGWIHIMLTLVFSIFCLVVGVRTSYKNYFLSNFQNKEESYLKDCEKTEMMEAKVRFENMSDEEYEIEEEEEEDENEGDSEDYGEAPTQMPSTNLKKMPFNISIDQKGLKKQNKKIKGKKRMKPTIGYAGDNRINVFESLESDNTDDEREDKWEEKKRKK
jgi:hypothetical protein